MHYHYLFNLLVCETQAKGGTKYNVMADVLRAPSYYHNCGTRLRARFQAKRSKVSSLYRQLSIGLLPGPERSCSTRPTTLYTVLVCITRYRFELALEKTVAILLEEKLHEPFQQPGRAFYPKECFETENPHAKQTMKKVVLAAQNLSRLTTTVTV